MSRCDSAKLCLILHLSLDLFKILPSPPAFPLHPRGSPSHFGEHFLHRVISPRRHQRVVPHFLRPEHERATSPKTLVCSATFPARSAATPAYFATVPLRSAATLQTRRVLGTF